MKSIPTRRFIQHSVFLRKQNEDPGSQFVVHIPTYSLYLKLIAMLRPVLQLYVSVDGMY